MMPQQARLPQWLGNIHDNNLIEELLAVTRVLPSWKACQVEGTSWAGTAQENIERYVSEIGVETF